ncbi:hypothetical protein BDM02DRAFT_2717807 [Thelephora ganbajun]|uniref:Uncharacterized protein n=1 Tax=Thelephora ganbajun TaxID=370292 RepID=A0ACB6ZC72_THEGA|nr:hypothetical protein BDM02DRAFT_2717807 [Thelephora ganbajun]
MPPPHHMSPSPSPVAMEPPVYAPESASVPPPPIVAEEATVETSTTSETSSETIPPRSAVRAKDYVYPSSKLRERDGRQPQRSRTPTPLSPGSTRMSDYGILSSPQVDARRMKAPVQVQHFEIERGTTPLREKTNRSWGLRKKKEAVPSLPVRIDASPAPVLPPPVTEDTIAAPRPRRPGKSPLSRISPSSSSSSSTSTVKGFSSSTSSTDRTRLDHRKDSSPGDDSRTPFGRLFKKRMKEYANEKGSTSGNSVDITVESPSESDRSLGRSNIPPEKPPQPALLTPDYRFVPLPPGPPATTGGRDQDRESSTTAPKSTGENQNQNLPPLAEFTNLISPGHGNVTGVDLPPGFVPNPPLPGQVQESNNGGQPPKRSASTRSKRKDRGPTYDAAPLTPGVQYPTPLGADIPRSKSRASRSSRQGQLPGAIDTP